MTAPSARELRPWERSQPTRNSRSWSAAPTGTAPKTWSPSSSWKPDRPAVAGRRAAQPGEPAGAGVAAVHAAPVSYTHLRAHETDSYLVCRLLLEKKKQNRQ